MDAMTSDDSEELLEKAIDFHGRLGPFLVLGIKMGLIGSKELGVKDLKCDVENPEDPFVNWLIDGIKVSTGCSPEVKRGKELVVNFTNQKGKSVAIRLKKELGNEILENCKKKSVDEVAYDVLNTPDQQLFAIKRGYPIVTGRRLLALAGIMAALANILSYPPFAIPLMIGPFESSIHFTQLAIFLCGVLAGPIAGLVTGAVGGIFMAATKIPFIIGGLAILGCASGILSKKVRPAFAGFLAWCVQAPYVVVTDYFWFTSIVRTPPSVATTVLAGIMVKLTLEALICSVLVEILVSYIRRSGILVS